MAKNNIDKTSKLKRIKEIRLEIVKIMAQIDEKSAAEIIKQLRKNL
ncbi:MAG: hypothetical protein NT141_01925 [candidate division WWE3 bacterium]|nr:hypothetical protein [candidate division WWE3 bacterium]